MNNLLKTAPKHIYLVVGEDCPDDVNFNELSEVTWCENDVDGNGVEYVIAKSEVGISLELAKRIVSTDSKVRQTARRELRNVVVSFTSTV